MREDQLYEVKSTFILQPGPAALTEGVAQLARGRVPQPNGLIVAAGGQCLAVRGKGQGKDSFSVPLEGGQTLPRGRVPDVRKQIVCDGKQLPLR